MIALKSISIDKNYLDAKVEALKGAFGCVDAVLLLAGGLENAGKEAGDGAPVYYVADIIARTSLPEQQAYRAALEARVWFTKALDPIRINGLKIAEAIAADLHAPIFREHVLATAIKKLHEQGADEIGVIAAASSQLGEAAFSILVESGEARVSWRKIIARNGIVDYPFDPGLPPVDDPVDPELSRQFPRVLRPDNLSFAFINGLSLPAPQTSAPVSTKPPVLFCVTSASPLQNRHSIEIFRELVALPPPVDVVAFRKNIDPFYETGARRVILLDAEPSISSEISTDVTLRELRRAAARYVKESPCVASKAALNWSLEKQSRKRVSIRLTQLATLGKLVEELRPRSIWTPEVVGAEGRIVVEAGWPKSINLYEPCCFDQRAGAKFACN